MSTTTKAQYDSWVDQDSETKNHGETPRLHMSNNSGSQRFSYIFFPRPFPINSIIAEAILKIHLSGTWSGTTVITVRPVSEKWKESRAGGITWKNKPGIAGDTITHEVVGGSDKDLIEVDITSIMQDVAVGSDWFGLRLTIDTNPVKMIYSSENTKPNLRPELFVDWSATPVIPNGLAPAGGTISALKPTLTWQYVSQSQFQVQIAVDESSFGTPEYDSGWIVSPTMALDLSGTAYAGVPEDTSRSWRVRVRDANGQETDWSDIVTFTRDSKGSLNITSPSSSPIDNVTPTITHTFTGQTQSSVQYIIEEFDPALSRYVVKYDTGQVQTTDLDFDLPANVITYQDLNYRITLRVWDTTHRVISANDPPYVEDVVIVQYSRSGVPGSGDFLDATDMGGPETLLEFGRTVRPDFFAVSVDGVLVESRIDPVDVETSPGADTYEYTLWSLVPGVEQEIEIESVVNDQHSDGNPTVLFTPTIYNKWLVAPEYGLKVAIIGPDPDFDIGSDSGVFYPLGRRDPVKFTGTIRGYEGDVSGSLTDYKGVTAEEFKQAFLDIIALSGETPLRLAWRDNNIEVGIGEPAGPQSTKAGWYNVAFPFWQIGAYTFDSPPQ